VQQQQQHNYRKSGSGNIFEKARKDGDAAATQPQKSRKSGSRKQKDMLLAASLYTCP